MCLKIMALLGHVGGGKKRSDLRSVILASTARDDLYRVVGIQAAGHQRQR